MGTCFTSYLGPFLPLPGGVYVNGSFAVPWPCAALERLGLSAIEQSRLPGPGQDVESREWCCQAGAGSQKPWGARVPGAEWAARGPADVAAQIPDLLPRPLSVLGAAKNP